MASGATGYNSVIRLGKHRIGQGQPCFIIAEAGVNHNGDPKLALELVRAAKKAGADCVKFQTFVAESLVTHSSPKANYQLKTTDPKESQFQMLKKLELPMTAYREILSLCKELDIQFLSTPYSLPDIQFLTELGVDGFKVASGQIAEPAFLDAVARTGKPMIVSTGMADMAEVSQAVDYIKAAGNRDLVILQCTTNYPSVPEEANLKAMVSMREALGVLTGYSDHTMTNYSMYGSIALGASVIEKHFTLDRNMEGPDHICSLDPKGFSEMVDGIRTIEAALGAGIKEPSEAEKVNALGMRRSIVSARDIQKGEKLTLENLAFKRPANGLSPKELQKILNRPASRSIQKDTQIAFDMVQWAEPTT